MTELIPCNSMRFTTPNYVRFRNGKYSFILQGSTEREQKCRNPTMNNMILVMMLPFYQTQSSMIYEQVHISSTEFAETRVCMELNFPI